MAVKRQKSMFDWLSKRPKQDTTGDPSTASAAADPGTQCANAESEADTGNPSNTVSTSTAETKSTSVDNVNNTHTVVENNTTDSHNSASTTSTDSQSTIIKQDKQPSKNDVFKIKWLETFSWLCQKEKGDKSPMFCRICQAHNKVNAMTNASGCTNFRHSTLTRHAQSQDHCEALQEEVMKKTFEKAATTAVQRSASNPGILAAFRTIFWMAQEDLSIRKYLSLMKFQKLQGCPGLENLAIANNATYYSNNTGEELLESIAEVIKNDVISKVKESELFSILIDESTDVSVCKQMMIYVKYVDIDFIPHTQFIGVLTIKDIKSDSSVIFNTVKSFLKANKLKLKNVLGFGSDGASVMIGRHKGVATRIKEVSPHCISIHCIAHRLNLCTSQASKGIDYLKKFEQLLSDLFYYFGGSKSGNRQCELAEIQKILDQPQVKIKECHEIRWIAFHDAVKAVHTSWLSLLQFFKQKKDSKSKSIYNQLIDYKFVAVLHMMMDVLPSISQMSLVFQRVEVDIAAIKPLMENLIKKIENVKNGNSHFQKELQEKIKKTKDDEGNLKSIQFKKIDLLSDDLRSSLEEFITVRKSFCQNMTDNLQRRFPQDSLDVSSAFSVLGMRNIESENSGENELNVLISHYGEDKVSSTGVTSTKLINADECRMEWSLAKSVVKTQKYPRESTQSLWQLMFKFHHDTFPNLIKLAKLCMIMPIQTADCERGFSVQNSIKTKKRNKLQQSHLNDLMYIKLGGGDIKEFDFSKVVSLWKDKKERRLFKKK